MKKKEPASYAIIGVGRFGSALARTLALSGRQIIICDKDADRVKELRDLTPYAFVVPQMSKEALDEIGVRNCEVGIVCIGNAIEVSILATLHLINLGLPRVIAKATTQDQGQILERLGAEVVYPEPDMGVRLGKKLLSNHLVDFFSLNDETEIYEMMIPDKYVGKSVQEVDLRAKYGLNIIAIERGESTITDISPNYRFEFGDGIVVIGRIDSIQRFESDQER